MINQTHLLICQMNLQTKSRMKTNLSKAISQGDCYNIWKGHETNCGQNFSVSKNIAPVPEHDTISWHQG